MKNSKSNVCIKEIYRNKKIIKNKIDKLLEKHKFEDLPELLNVNDIIDIGLVCYDASPYHSYHGGAIIYNITKNDVLFKSDLDDDYIILLDDGFGDRGIAFNYKGYFIYQDLYEYDDKSYKILHINTEYKKE